MQCVILAGGLGTRMLPVTAVVPKVLLPVAGRPFASWQLEWLAAQDITSVVYCIGHLGQLVRDHVRDEGVHGLDIAFVEERDELMGTAGALRLAADEGVLEPTFLVLYGDSWLQVDPAAVLRTAMASPLPALMTVHRNDGAWDRSNVEYSDGIVIRYEKNLDPVPAAMRWIDYGLLAFDRGLITDRVPAGEPSDLAPLCTALAREQRLAGFEVAERFYEIGSAEGLRELDALLSRR